MPGLLAARGVSRRAMLLGLAGLAVLAIVVVVVAKALDDNRQITVAGPPQFNLVYDKTLLHPVKARPGELVRLEGRRPHVRVALTARRFTAPAYGSGDIIGGYLPVLGEQREEQLRTQYGPIQVYDEGKARFGEHTGFQIGFSAKTPSGPMFGRDAYVLPADSGARDGVLLSLRRYLHGHQTAADQDYFKNVKLAYGSFNFGDGRP